ncbi:glycosyltransferase [Chitinophaga japonensis]|uniref:Cellulose synthase/poly-beta-1,6-N-acetylglucosamine synthase-like glycosyltransferase n=1 Tax=Chitinophaga japonensis TaxID=104662 RepID=A0A562TGP8_CHIJA|nr:glycosyltransferase [Chitinophaga japonensis]TWI92070.1 cellulose synthase/poly-beta-1,6-N-acetylglucosamine synthase-like glycosyltransferase [Chitinophaga japonensis]
MQVPRKAHPPSRTELLTLRLMILIGIAGMGFLLYYLLNPRQVGYAPFYWMLMAGIFFTCLRILHEWYHYFYITVPPAPPPGRQFTVDIFTTFCAGEPYPMIVETLQAIQAIRYPHNTYLCDEANDPYLAEVCRQLGVHHVTRTDKRDAKAGNINNALKQSGGELCVVLDPDHVPLPEFLDPIVPYFNDAAIGFVQVVQAYSNQSDSMIARGAAQQTFQFYGPMMMTMNRYGTVQAIGANCTFRRTALESIGGHAAGLAEDMHTAMQLHAKGWKSVYVPEVLTYGLVPSTLSAYYKQQLKWARGTFELLVTSYPRLFKKFTWRQRLHYGIIPFHYLSGIVFLINFLVPVLSLVLGFIPLRVDLLSFALAGLPFLTATLGIRHFVQRWVMGEDERGNHIVGGLLLIGTWWIYILGLVYTIIRKKVPYIPTPKDDSEPDSWTLNIPNAAVALCSAGAIVYGLYTDWNPFAWVMAGIAGMNCGIMLFNIVISRRHQLARIRNQSGTVRSVMEYVVLLKLRFWFFRHRVYNGVRRFALLLLICIFTATILFMAAASKMPTRMSRRIQKQDIFYAGIYSPGASTAMQQVNAYQQDYNCHFNIISLQLPWNNRDSAAMPGLLLDSIYANGSYPLITWMPPAGRENILQQILAGDYDPYLALWASRLKALNKPVYLRFAPEPDDPAGPWAGEGVQAPAVFRAAWQYVHDYFGKRGVYNVVWVWSIAQPEAVAAWFPGARYVDWLCVPCRHPSFTTAYAPFHRSPVFRSGLPVMVLESAVPAGSAAGREARLKEALEAADRAYREIKALVCYNGGIDSNLSRSVMDRYRAFNRNGFPDRAGRLPALAPATRPPLKRLALPDTIRGVNYQKGRHWYRSFHALTRREIQKDFTAMKQAGINTIKRTGPGVYDRNILSVAAQCNMKVHYSFSVPDVSEMASEPARPEKVTQDILATVKKLKGDSSIIAWNIADTSWQQLAARFYKPTLTYQQYACAAWLGELVARIRAEDPGRPVTMDVRVNGQLEDVIQQLQQQVPEIDAFGLIIPKEDTAGARQISGLTAPCFISQVSVPQYVQMGNRGKSAFIRAWQDIGDRDYLAFEGLVDHWGRHKRNYYYLKQYWVKKEAVPVLSPVKILRPAALTRYNETLTYHAILYRNSQWQLASAHPQAGLRFEWYLVRTDQWHNPVAMKRVGSGARLRLQIPEDPSTCRLYLVAARGSDVTTAQAPLNIPVLYTKRRPG